MTPTNSISGNATFSISGTRWKFCTDCGTKLGETWKHCAECGKLIGFASLPFVSGTGTPVAYPKPGDQITPTFQALQQRCAFDGLPPGAYGLLCTCPKCSRATC